MSLTREKLDLAHKVHSFYKSGHCLTDEFQDLYTSLKYCIEWLSFLQRLITQYQK